MNESSNPNLFYWNTADDKDHTHKRIEWAIENGMLVCINIHIQDKLLGKVKPGDIILAYEPKYHKISNYENGNDGYCMSCKFARHDGMQAFTSAFLINDIPIKITNEIEYEQCNNIFRNWFSLDKHNTDLTSAKEYIKKYLSCNNNIYIYPCKHLGKLKQIISTNIASNNTYKYYGSVRKGFNTFEDIYLKRIIIKQFADSL
jgi:hypothetical protein